MTFMMVEAAFGGRLLRRVNDPQKLLMADFALQGHQVIFQLGAEAFEFGKEGVAIILQLVADLLALAAWSRC